MIQVDNEQTLKEHLGEKNLRGVKYRTMDEKKNETRYEIKGIIIKRKKNVGKYTVYNDSPKREC